MALKAVIQNLTKKMMRLFVFFVEVVDKGSIKLAIDEDEDEEGVVDDAAASI